MKNTSAMKSREENRKEREEVFDFVVANPEHSALKIGMELWKGENPGLSEMRAYRHLSALYRAKRVERRNRWTVYVGGRRKRVVWYPRR